MKNLALIFTLLIFLWSCQTKSNVDTTGEKEPLTFSLTEIWRSDSVMKTPEAVFYDAARDVLYVANMNRIDEGDDTGFITKMATDGTVIDLQWISGLNEPRGMGIHGDKLFVTDMDRIVIIDVIKGEVLKFVPVDSSVFLNDLAVTKEGAAYFSDSRTGIVHKYSEEGELTQWLTGLEGPNGLFDLGDQMIVSASGSGEVRLVSKATGEYEVMATGVGVDGIEYSGVEDYYILSEWGGRIHVVGNDTIQKILDTEAQKINSADIGYHMSKKIVYVPTFFDNRVVAYKLNME